MKIKSLVAICLVCGSFALAACHQGPAEKAGEAIDHAGNQVSNKVEDMTNTGGPAEKAGEKVDNAVYNASH